MSSSDITMRRRAELALQARNVAFEKLNAELEKKVEERSEALAKSAEALLQAEKFAALGRISSSFAHMVNTPLGVALTSMTYLGELLRKLDSDCRAKTLRGTDLENFIDNGLSGVEMACGNLGKAVGILAKFRQLSQVSDRETPVTVDPSIFFGKLLDELRHRYPGMRLEFDLSETDTRPATLYPGMLRKITEELLQNAVVHGMAGAGGGTVHLGFRSLPDACFAFDFRNDGAPIPDDVIAHILEPFSGHDLSNTRGSLGMATIHALLLHWTQLESFRVRNTADGVSVEIRARFKFQDAPSL
jgi:signal transduction histidine kinase